jgi:hypothetical protein
LRASSIKYERSELPVIARQVQRSLASRVLGNGQEISVGILEPRYARATRSQPNTGLVLLEPRIALQGDAMSAKTFDDVRYAGNLPAEDSEGVWWNRSSFWSRTSAPSLSREIAKESLVPERQTAHARPVGRAHLRPCRNYRCECAVNVVRARVGPIARGKRHSVAATRHSGAAELPLLCKRGSECTLSNQRSGLIIEKCTLTPFHPLTSGKYVAA